MKSRTWHIDTCLHSLDLFQLVDRALDAASLCRRHHLPLLAARIQRVILPRGPLRRLDLDAPRLAELIGESLGAAALLQYVYPLLSRDLERLAQVVGNAYLCGWKRPGSPLAACSSSRRPGVRLMPLEAGA